MISKGERLNKVAKVTLFFWLIKILATTLGETLGDYISMTLDLGYTVGIAITFSMFAVILTIQLISRRFIPSIYWAVIIATTTLGTEISDFIDRTLKLGYFLGSALLAGCLITALLLWFKRYKSTKVYPIVEFQKELYYWTAILFSNSLGTAFGDFLSDNLGMGYLTAAIVSGTIILVVVILHYRTKLNPVFLFWLAFVFTRPFGATFGDFLTKPLAKGGLAIGTLPSSMVSAALLVLLIYIAYRAPRKRELTL
ncbi:MAG: hypothetical protein EOP04_07350 [Proteobacteria bacterium]|nr:MAG: hypothetical protein EOP04_07350 [Pseudomonadota bacterium]